MQEIKQAVLKKMDADITEELTTDEEYLFAIGYAMRYVNKCSKVSNKIKAHNINKLLLSKDGEELYNNFMQTYKKNMYNIYDNKRYNNLIGMLIGYKLDNLILNNKSKDLITAGYLYTA